MRYLMKQKRFAWADTYGIDIVDGEDDITILATAVVIDQVNNARRSNFSG
jgi:uncharacterized protein YxjI